MFLLKQKKLFGENVPPRCEYCRFSEKNIDGRAVCQYSAAANEACKKYEYDPLKREPRSAPVLPRFSADDFKL